MADKRISALDTATALGGTEQLPLVQSGTTKKTTVNRIKNYLIATNLTAQASVNVDLANYPDAHIVHLSWSGANGTATYTLPS